MTANNETFALPHDIEAIFDSLKIDLDPKMKRRVTDALAQLVENNRAIETRATAATGIFGPILTADPASPADGQAWINATAGKARVRINGLTADLN